MSKSRKVLLSVAVLLVLLGSGVAVWFSEASIFYGFNYDYEYLKENGNWVTFDWSNNKTMDGMFLSVECHNRGLMGGNFNVVIELTNATISTQTPQQYLQINNSTAKFPLTLNGGGHQTIDAYFKVDNVSQFDLKVSFESSQAFMRSAENNWAGVNTMSYFLDDSGNSYRIGGMIS